MTSVSYGVRGRRRPRAWVRSLPWLLAATTVALQIAYQRLKKLEARPTGKALRLHLEPWRPWRGAAALLLWHYYGAATLDEAR